MAGQDAVVGTAAPPPPTSLAPGFRFHPTDEELVMYYLRRKARGQPFKFQAVTETDVYKSEPWELSGFSALKTRDPEWYFFSPTDKKYGNGSRLNRTTGQGFWKATGKDRPVKHENETIGMKKTLVFHYGRSPDGQRTNWIMHEYRLSDSELQNTGVVQNAFVLCRIFQKSAIGPPNGDQFAPFMDEEWENNNNGATLMITGGDAANVGEEAGVPRTLVDEAITPLTIAPPQATSPVAVESLSRAFDSSNVEKSVPPGFLKFVRNLESEIISASMKRDELKIEVMRAHATVDFLQSRVNVLSTENEDIRRRA